MVTERSTVAVFLSVIEDHLFGFKYRSVGATAAVSVNGFNGASKAGPHAACHPAFHADKTGNSFGHTFFCDRF
jgi:hypothetical protein